MTAVGGDDDARHVLGRKAEDVVVCRLMDDGYVIVGRNVRVSRLEIDIIARDGPVIAVVEVRARGPGAWVRGLDTLDWRKRQRIRRAGEFLWRRRFKEDTTIERMRFDVASVTFDERGEAHVEHVKAAF